MRTSSEIGRIKLPIQRIHLEVTSHCNFACEFCPDSKMERGRGFMDFDLLRRILELPVRYSSILWASLFFIRNWLTAWPKGGRAYKDNTILADAGR